MRLTRLRPTLSQDLGTAIILLAGTTKDCSRRLSRFQFRTGISCSPSAQSTLKSAATWSPLRINRSSATSPLGSPCLKGMNSPIKEQDQKGPQEEGSKERLSFQERKRIQEGKRLGATRKRKGEGEGKGKGERARKERRLGSELTI